MVLAPMALAAAAEATAPAVRADLLGQALPLSDPATADQQSEPFALMLKAIARNMSASTENREGNATDAESTATALPHMAVEQRGAQDMQRQQQQQHADSEGDSTSAGNEVAFLRTELASVRGEAAFLHKLLAKQSDEAYKLSDHLADANDGMGKVQAQLRAARLDKAEADARAREASAAERSDKAAADRSLRAAAKQAAEQLAKARQATEQEVRQLQATTSANAVLQKEVRVLGTRFKEQQRKGDSQQQVLSASMQQLTAALGSEAALRAQVTAAGREETALERRIRDRDAARHKVVVALAARAVGQKQGSLRWFEAQVAGDESALPNATDSQRVTLEAAEIASLKAERHLLLVNFMKAKEGAPEAQTVPASILRETNDELRSSQKRTQAAKEELIAMQAEENKLKAAIHREHAARRAAEKEAAEAKGRRQDREPAEA